MTTLNFGTLNVRGFKKIEHNDKSRSLHLQPIIADINKHSLDVLAVQETHLGEAVYSQKEKDYTGFFVNEDKNKHHGAGIIIRNKFKPNFQKISARVCSATFKLDNNKPILFICGYAPHETLAKKQPQLKNNFYNDLQKALLLRKANTIVILALDANALTSFDPDNNPNNVLGKFTKGDRTNGNGETLIHFAAENNLSITNTRFQHKMSRRTTWTAPYKPLKLPNGETRRNPIRNQIDYIAISNNFLRFVTNARSYGNFKTSTDHKLVIMNIKLQLPKLNNPKKTLTPKKIGSLFSLIQIKGNSCS